MPAVYLSIGSNVDREHHVALALDHLQQRFGALHISPVYSCEAMGFVGDEFLNLVVQVDTNAGVAEVSSYLKALEDANGRRRDQPRYSSRTLDIDILLYDDVVGFVDGVQLPRGEILKHAFVLRPLADLVPEKRHPVTQATYAALWAAFDRPQKLARVDFDWRGQALSRAQ